MGVGEGQNKTPTPLRNKPARGVRTRATSSTTCDETAFPCWRAFDLLPIEDVVGTDEGASANLSDGSVAVLAEERAHRGLGNALALSVRAPSDDIYLFAAQEGSVLARRAALFTGAIEVF